MTAWSTPIGIIHHSKAKPITDRMETSMMDICHKRDERVVDDAKIWHNNSNYFEIVH